MKRGWNKRGWIIAISIIVIALVLLLIFSKFTGNVISPFNCVDSDGRNYFIKGTTQYGPAINGTDYCINNNQLKEYYCENNQPKLEVYNCPTTCENGACIKAETPETATLPAEKNNTWMLWIGLLVVVLAIGIILYTRFSKKR